MTYNEKIEKQIKILEGLAQEYKSAVEDIRGMVAEIQRLQYEKKGKWGRDEI